MQWAQLTASASVAVAMAMTAVGQCRGRRPHVHHERRAAGTMATPTSAVAAGLRGPLRVRQVRSGGRHGHGRAVRAARHML